MFPKLLLDEFELKVKKVDLLKSNIACLSHNFIERNISNYKYATFISKTYSKSTYGVIKSKFTPKLSLKPISKVQHKKNTEVVVKLTSCDRNFKSIAKHIDYITRNGKIDYFIQAPEYERNAIEYIYTHEGGGLHVPLEIASSFRAEAKDFYNDCAEKFGKKEKRETYNFVFSMKDYLGTTEFGFDPQFVRIAAVKTIEIMYPDNFYVAALHTDTNNPHTHICLKSKNDKTEKYIDLRKADLIQMRKIFAFQLNKLGIEATATFKKDRINLTAEKQKAKNIERALEEQVRENAKNKPNYNPLNFMISNAERDLKRSSAINGGFFQIVDFGKKKFKTSDKKESFFITYHDKNFKPITIWGKDLERLIKENNLQIGSYAKFQKLGTCYEPNTRQAHIKDNLFEITEYLATTKWDCISFDTNSRTASKSKFAPKLETSKKPETTSKFIKKLNKGEINDRPNRIKSQRKYTREEWAKYKSTKIQRDITICFANSIKNIPNKPRNIAQIPKYLRSMSASDLDTKRAESNNVLLHSNSHDNIREQSTLQQFNHELRSANQINTTAPSAKSARESMIFETKTIDSFIEKSEKNIILDSIESAPHSQQNSNKTAQIESALSDSIESDKLKNEVAPQIKSKSRINTAPISKYDMFGNETLELKEQWETLEKENQKALAQEREQKIKLAQTQVKNSNQNDKNR